jgi:hypothetical protein
MLGDTSRRSKLFIQDLLPQKLSAKNRPLSLRLRNEFDLLAVKKCITSKIQM